jgi:hypothetical protein
MYCVENGKPVVLVPIQEEGTQNLWMTATNTKSIKSTVEIVGYAGQPPTL